MEKIKVYAAKLWQRDIVHTGVYAIILTIIIECLNKRSLIGLIMPFINPVIFLYNALIVMIVLSLALFFKRRLFAYCMLSLLWLIPAIINFVVLYSRKTPFTAMDIYLLSDAIKVIPVYLSIAQMLLIAVGIILVTIGLVILCIKGPKKTEKINYIKRAVSTAALAGVLYAATIVLLMTGTISTYFGNIANSYKKYGFPYCFSCSIVDRGVSKEADYSLEYMEELKQNLDNGEALNSETRPNIIFLQLESFFDPELVKDVTFSEEVLPNFKRLKQDYSSGFLNVPCFGAGTANTEFEIQTGMNIDDFGPGEYPYKTVLQTKVCETTAFDLKELGYTTYALHDNDGTFYDRYKVFSHLGYDTFTSIEYMKDYEETPMNWAKDKVLTGEINKMLDKTEGSDYIYAISVQGHGDYPSTMPEGYFPKIKTSGFFDSESEQAFTYYVNQLHEMDEFIGELVDSLSVRDEETVLIMYGDHLPGFSFTEDNLENADIYQTQYVIWNNFGMSNEKRDMEAYQLSSYVLERLGISEGYINKFHQTQRETDDYLKNLKILEYDLLYGECDLFNGEMPYKVTNMEMGTDDIIIKKAYNYKNYVCIEGENFNDFSVVLINDSECISELINGNLIKVTGVSVKPGDVVSVIQRGKDKIELSRVYYTYITE